MRTRAVEGNCRRPELVVLCHFSPDPLPESAADVASELLARLVARAFLHSRHNATFRRKTAEESTRRSSVEK